MYWLKIPPLNSLRAFATVAETNSYTRAAEQLNVTHAAVSQQVRQLEKRIGFKLVQRQGRGIRLTQEGQILAQDLTLGFNAIGRAVERVSAAAADRPVQITTSPAFAVEWLLPRIPEFQSKHPDIPLMLNPTGEVVELRHGGVDLAVRYRDRRRPAPGLTPLLTSDMVVVGTHELLGDRDLSQPEALAELPWLQELGTNEAAEWFTLHGVVPEHPLNVTQMPGNLIMTSVRRGDGVTYTARAFFQEDIAKGRMKVLFSEKMFGLYYIETQPEPLRANVKTLVDWLQSKSETVSA